jgi:hypothetical protein
VGPGAAGVPAPLPALRARHPIHDTPCDVLNALDPGLCKSCFLAWVDGLRDGDRMGCREF